MSTSQHPRKLSGPMTGWQDSRIIGCSRFRGRRCRGRAKGKSRAMDLVMAFLLVQVFILFVAWAVLR